MKKVLIASEGSDFSGHAFEFALHLHKDEPILLTGVFLNSFDYSRLWFYPVDSSPDFAEVAIEEDQKKILRSIETFTKLCIKNQIRFRVHTKENFTLSELWTETRFADILVIDSETFYKDPEEVSPNSYLKMALHYSECPVVLITPEFRSPNSVVITYDGRPSSVFAAKQFAYLFPQWAKLETILIYDPANDEDIPGKQNVEELTLQHFPKLRIQNLKESNQSEEFAQWLKNKQDTLVIAGSFGRSWLSRIMKKSFISETLKDQQQPFFIAHK